jgi:hypothetical protein
MNKKDVYQFCYYMARDNKKLDIEVLKELFSLLGLDRDLPKVEEVNAFLEKMRSGTELPTKCIGCFDSGAMECCFYKGDGRHCQNWLGDIKGVTE